MNEGVALILLLKSISSFFSFPFIVVLSTIWNMLEKDS